jgi:hypothetical protein
VCRACSKPRDPREFAGGPIAGVCWHCYEWHAQAIQMLSGAPPGGCQMCNRTMAELDELSRRAGRADTRLVLHRKDGIYQILCLDCDAGYVPSRRDLYGKTPDGVKRGL